MSPLAAARSQPAPLRQKPERLDLRAVSVPRFDSKFLRELALDDTYTGYLSVSAHLEDPHPSRILRDKGDRSLRVGEFYDRMLASDLDLSSFSRKRKDAVLALPRRIAPADSSPLAKETAEFMIEAVGRVPNFHTNLEHQQTALDCGIAFEEVIYEKISRGPLAGAILPVDLIDRPMWRFLFRHGELFVRQSPGAPGKEPIVAPYGKFLMMRNGSKDSPWGKALLDDIYWTWWFKKNGWKFYAIFLDKWAQPTAIGKYKHKSDDKTNQQSQADLLAVLSNIQTEFGFAIPDSLSIELMEAKRSGDAGYERFIAICTRSQALAYLGEIDTSGQAKGPGSFAKSEVSDGVRGEKVISDAHALATNLRDNLFKPVIALNFGPDAPVPRLVIDTVELEERGERRDGIEAALKHKQPVGKRYFYQTMQVPEPEDGEPMVEAAPEPKPVAPVPPPPPSGSVNENPTPEKEAAPAGGAPTGAEPSNAPAAAAAAAHRSAHLAAAPPPDAVSSDEPADDLTALAEQRDADLAEIDAHFAAVSLAYYGDIKARFLAAWDDGDLQQGASGNGFRRVVGEINPLDNARALETAQIHALGVALMHLKEDVGAGALKLGMGTNWQSATDPHSAIEYWANQLTLPKDVFTELSDEARRTAFTVAGVTDLELLSAIHALVGEAIAGGWVRERFAAAMDALFTAKGVEPLAPWHVDLIYANATRTAASLMRYRQLVENPAAKRLTPYLQYWSLDDGRVRPEHQAMHGYIAAVDHPIWQTWMTPAGHNCRCYISTINLAKARRMGLTGMEPKGPWPMFEGAPVMPDEGFAGTPDFGEVDAEMRPRAEALLEDARATGDTDLFDALMQLFRQLFDFLAAKVDFAAFVTPGSNLKRPAA